MPKLIKKNPTGTKGKLYSTIDDDLVDPGTEIFTWTWISSATRTKAKKTFLTHLEAGHFGPYEVVAEDNFRLLEGHRAICRFNNKRYKDQPVLIVTRDQYSDMMSGKPVRDMTVLVGGRIMTKPASLKNYNSDEFLALRRYRPDQANILAIDRVEIDIAEEKVKWHILVKKTEEYKRHYKERWRFYNDMYLKEVVLVARETASEEEILRSSDLPASILTLIDDKLSITQSAKYISRWMDFQYVYTDEEMKNPALSFRIHQVILEEIMIEHYRDLQRLHGDVIDKPTQDALKDAMARHERLMPVALPKLAEPDPPPDEGTEPPEVTPDRSKVNTEETEFVTS